METLSLPVLHHLYENQRMRRNVHMTFIIIKLDFISQFLPFFAHNYFNNYLSKLKLLKHFKFPTDFHTKTVSVECASNGNEKTRR